ncbi:MAG: signal recognition particle-docking protein FtsY [Treponema sp.]|uniref:signal recognition particle-docking protein FtsY n=1 Tax=Treponema sp. TaxID=166 RepID=UPI0025FA9A17|nr:signal recognition particle-docking protein FtsY [Treponema sp.]MBQ9623875.1 signal recognition particle-docking protein FtsY [Treponema sp.]MBR0101811.1 signal recognition particle-docking protein FtsY [Treponema sp.]MBR0495590.1 signal recognition particle-docking protein FtsY [Treponema sp.]
MAKLSFAQKFKNLFSSKKIDEEFFDDLTDALVEGDMGAKLAYEITEELEKICREKKISDEDAIKSELKSMLSSYIKACEFTPEPGKVNVYMMLGVNGVGKTTTAAKIAKLYKERGEKVIMAASDTFRAAAEEQLEMHGERLGIRVIAHQHGSDPSAVVFDAAESCRANGGGVIIADTAGRLHNKENLVRELQKIDRIAAQKADEGCFKKILVIDGTTGQNALRQAEVFSESVGVDAIVITKYDSTARGGCVFTIGKQLGIPVLFVCTGEKYENIQPFEPEKYVEEFLGN